MKRRGRTIRELPAEARMLIIRGIAEFARNIEIREALRDQLGIEDVTESTLFHYRSSPKYEKQIADFRADLKNRVRDLAISSKFWRLAQLERIFRQEDRVRVTHYTKAGEKEYVPVEEHPTTEVRMLLRQTAEELGELQNAEATGAKPLPVLTINLHGIPGITADAALEKSREDS